MAWRAPGGDLDGELRERWETFGSGGGIHGFFRSVCREFSRRPYGAACLQLLTSQYKAGLLCLAILLALTLLCSTMEHIEMPPDPDTGGAGPGGE